MAQFNKLTLYHTLPCRSARVAHLLEELKDAGVDLSDQIETKKIKFDFDYLMSPEYKKMNPLSTIPVLTDHDSVTINESCGILLFILKTFGKGHLQPAGDAAADWAQYLTWIFRAETVLAAPLERWMMHSEKSPIPPEMRKADVAEAAWQQTLKGFQVLEEALEGNDFLVNNTFSAADIAAGYSAGFWVAMFPDIKTEPAAKFPNVRMYNDRVMCRPAAMRVWAGFPPPPEACQEYGPPAKVAAEEPAKEPVGETA